MRRLHLAVVAGAVLCFALAAVLAPPLSRTTEAPAARATAAAVASPAGAAPAATDAATPAAATAAATATTATVDAGGSLASAVRGTISSATLALSAATADDRVIYAAALRARDAGAYGYAIDAFHTVVARGGVLAPVASLRMAQTLVSADRRPEAAAAFAATLARADLPPELVTTARFAAADNADALHDAAGALTLLDAIRDDRGASSYDRSAAAWQAAQIRRDAGDAAWADDAAAAITLQPASGSAVSALDAIDAAQPAGAAPVDVPPLTAAYVRYRAYQNADATARYQAIVEPASMQDAAIARFYLGALDERANDQTAALADYAKSLADDPTGRLADDARYWRARIYEDRGDYQAAVAEYDTLVADFPSSAFASDARLRAALQLALHGDATDALTRLRAIATTAGPDDAAAAARWSEVFRAQYGLAPDPSLDPRAIDPVSLPALLDAHSTDPLPAAAFDEQPVMPSDDAAIAPWMTATFGPRPSAALDPSPVGTARYTLGRVLVGVGETSVGESILRNLVADADGHPYALLDLAQAAREIDLPDVETLAARRILAPLTSQQQLAAPKALLALSFPVPYLEDATAAATRFSVPPLLLLALVRQESAFDASAGSGAGALGLAQVTPPTGALIADALGVPWSTSILFDPATSLQFGAYYLGAQLEQFDGDVFPALAAYNAGPGNAAHWAAAAPFPGADGYLLAVDFSETDAYLARVLENYAWYRYIYAGAATPSLR